MATSAWGKPAQGAWASAVEDEEKEHGGCCWQQSVGVGTPLLVIAIQVAHTGLRGLLLSGLRPDPGARGEGGARG